MAIGHGRGRATELDGNGTRRLARAHRQLLVDVPRYGVRRQNPSSDGWRRRFGSRSLWTCETSGDFEPKRCRRCALPPHSIGLRAAPPFFELRLGKGVEPWSATTSRDAENMAGRTAPTCDPSASWRPRHKEASRTRQSGWVRGRSPNGANLSDLLHEVALVDVIVDVIDSLR